MYTYGVVVFFVAGASPASCCGTSRARNWRARRPLRPRGLVSRPVLDHHRAQHGGLSLAGPLLYNRLIWSSRRRGAGIHRARFPVHHRVTSRAAGAAGVAGTMTPPRRAGAMSVPCLQSRRPRRAPDRWHQFCTRHGSRCAAACAASRSSSCCSSDVQPRRVIDAVRPDFRHLGLPGPTSC